MSEPAAMKRLDDLTAELWMEIADLSMGIDEFRDEIRDGALKLGAGIQRVRRMAGLEALPEPRVIRRIEKAS